MKITSFLFCLILTTSFTSLNAYDKTIKMQIAEIQNAPKEKRVTLMNNLKTKMANMSVYERSKIIDALEQNQNLYLKSSMLTQKIIETRKQEEAQRIQAQTYSHLTQYQSFLQLLSDAVQTWLLNPGSNAVPTNDINNLQNKFGK